MVLVKPKTRWGACGYHLAVSSIIFAVLAVLIILVWYPSFLFQTDGGWDGIKLIAGVDLVLGPMLTLIVYKATKSTLKFDLSVIAAIQISALIYGTWLVYQERPRAIVFAEGEIRVIAATAFPEEIRDDALDVIQEIGGSPVWIYASISIEGFESLSEQDKKFESFKDIYNNGLLHTRYETYEPFHRHAQQIKSQALHMSSFRADHESIPYQVGNLIYRFKSRYVDGLIELDKKTLKYVALHNFRYGL